MDKTEKLTMEHLNNYEKQRIADMMREKKDGEIPGANSMDWMYRKTTTSADDYLLGKKVDKHFEKGDEPPPMQDDVFGERIKANIALDMQAKMREDPLYAIKKREEESHKKILHNPVKMKELQQLIALKKEKKRKRKHKQKQGRSHNDSDLVQQYLSVLSEKHKHLERSEPTRSKFTQKLTSQTDIGDQQSKSKPDGKRVSRKRYDEREVRQRNKWTKKFQGKEISSSSESEDTIGQDKKFDNTCTRSPRGYSSAEAKPPKYGLIKSSRQRARSRSKSKSKSPVCSRVKFVKHQDLPIRSRDFRQIPEVVDNGKNFKTSIKRRMSSEERQHRIKEMMDNAKWRNDQRKFNVQRYQKEDRREEAQRKTVKGSSADFLNPLMVQHANASTVEDRLKRNKYNIQRTNVALEKDFTKH